MRQFLEDEDKKKLLEKSKQLYSKLPKKKDEIFSYPLNWNALF